MKDLNVRQDRDPASRGPTRRPLLPDMHTSSRHEYLDNDG